MDILVVLEDSNGKIHRLGLEAIVGAQALANSQNLSVASLVIGKNADDLSFARCVVDGTVKARMKISSFTTKESEYWWHFKKIGRQ